MKHERVLLGDAVLDTFVPSPYEGTEDPRKPFVIICPGGGYTFWAPREAECVATKMNAFGFNSAVLYYSLVPAKHPKQLCELANAVKYVRENAGELNTYSDRIVVLGFSAGGHLAGLLGTLWSEKWLDSESGTTAVERMPNAFAMAYTPVSSEPDLESRFASFRNLLGKDATKEMKDSISLEKLVKNDTPPAFIWATWNDSRGKPANSLLFANAMFEHGRDCEIHIYRNGEHGLGLATKDYTNAKHPRENLRVANWVNDFRTWVEEIFDIREESR